MPDSCGAASSDTGSPRRGDGTDRLNLLLLTEADRVEGDRFRVAGPRARHLREVLRAEPGRELRVGLLEGPTGTARVVASGDDAAVLDCGFGTDTPPRPATDLIVAVPRAKTLRRLLPDVAAMGVDHIVLLRTWRVAKPYLAQTILDPAVHRPLLHEGMMQGRTTREPRVAVERRFRPFVEDRLSAFAAGARAFVAHPGAETPLARVELAPGERVVLAVGPEGGFLAAEVEAFRGAGFLPVTMGERTLRVETACVALLAQLDLLRRRGA